LNRHWHAESLRDFAFVSQFRLRRQILSIVFDSVAQVFCLKSSPDLTATRSRCRNSRPWGALRLWPSVGGITFDAGEDALTVYRFNTGVAQHYFCSRCGIYTHHRRRSNPNQYGVNVACLKGVSPFDFADVPVIDGVNHPADRGRGYEIVGHLHFIRTDDHSAADAAQPNS
jgi:hypothetical protein